MKKKFMPIFVAMTAMLTAGLISCGSTDTSTSSNPTTSGTPTTSVTPTTTVTPTTSSEPTPSTPEVIHVDSVTITAEKTSLFVGDETTVTVSVLPETAADKTYTLSSENEAVATVTSEGKVTAIGAGKTNIVITSTDGGKQAKVEIIVSEASAPAITMPEQTTYTVAVDQTLTLPTITAKNYRGDDITKNMEISDLAESGTIADGVFSAKIAGEHKISYYIEDDNGEDEQFLTINVTAAHEETFDVGDATDPAALKNYGVYKENFANGRKNKLGITDQEGASYIYGGENAISGNSLIIDAHKTAGHALKAVMMMGFNENFVRGVSTTYKVSFDYKILSNASNLGDFYLGLSWDGFDGINRNFVNTKANIGEVVHYEAEFSGTIVPVTGNAWFSFWKMGGKEATIAIDNLVFESVKEAQTTPVVPSSEQLLADGGFTWNMGDKGCTISSGKAIVVDNFEDETLKATMKASSLFGETAMQLTGADGHLFSGLTKDNMISGKKITIKVNYVAANENGLCLIMMGTNGNPTLETKVTKNDDGTKTISFEGVVQDGWYQLNIYGHNNPSFNLIVGSIDVALTDADPIPEDETPNGHKVGDKWSYNTRQFGNCDEASRAVQDFDNNSEVLAESAMGSAPKKITFKSDNVTIEWKSMSNKIIEAGMTYKITCDYFVTDTNNGALMYRMDMQFENIGSTSLGYHHSEISITPGASVDFFSFFCPGTTGFVGTFYVNAVTIELTAIAK